MSHSKPKTIAVSCRIHKPIREFSAPKRWQTGFTLIEVLITFLVLAIGLVGIAALHLNAMRFAHSSYYISLASTVALDLEERLWIELGRDTSSGCLDATSASGVVTALQTQWRTGSTLQGSQAIVIPNVSITPGTISTPAGENSWTEVPIQITWADQRFEGAGIETFPYKARVVCFSPATGT